MAPSEQLLRGIVVRFGMMGSLRFETARRGSSLVKWLSPAKVRELAGTGDLAMAIRRAGRTLERAAPTYARARLRA